MTTYVGRTIVVTARERPRRRSSTDRMWQWGVQAVSETSTAADGSRSRRRSATTNTPSSARAATLESAGPCEVRDVDDEIAQVAPAYLAPDMVRGGQGVGAGVADPVRARRPTVTVTVIDPGSAFGLGDHPTTQTSMALLASCSRGDPGCRRCWMSAAGRAPWQCWRHSSACRRSERSTSPTAAVESTRHNMALNGVERAIEVDTTPLDRSRQFDIVMANILAPVLVVDGRRSPPRSLVPAARWSSAASWRTVTTMCWRRSAARADASLARGLDLDRAALNGGPTAPLRGHDTLRPCWRTTSRRGPRRRDPPGRSRHARSDDRRPVFRS